MFCDGEDGGCCKSASAVDEFDFFANAYAHDVGEMMEFGSFER